MPSGKVLVLGNDTRSFLSVIRSLGRRGLRVHVAWCDPEGPACRSRFVRKVHQIPAYSPSDVSWKTMLGKILSEESFDLVLPCDDPSIIPLQTHRGELASLARIYLLEDEVFRVAYNKQESAALARRLGVPVPAEVELRGIESLEAALELTGLPAVLKPLSSFVDEDLINRRDVEKAFTRAAAESIASRMLTRGPILVQENVVGQGTGVEVIADKGEILSAFQHLRLHEPLHGGAATYRKSVDLDPQMYAATERILGALGYSGVAMLEFKRNPATGRWVFLEINGRFWGSLPLALAAGIDFPWYLYQLMVSRARSFNRSYRTGVYCRDLTGDIDWFRSNMAADRSSPYLHTVPVATVIAELGNILSLREYSDTFTVDDPYPGFVDLAGFVHRKWKGLRRHLAINSASWRLPRSMARKAILDALSRRREILYVCTGNICRSPFASYLTRSIAGPGFAVESRGILFQDGRQCPANAVAAARAQGIDMTIHKAEQVDAAALRDASVVFVFDDCAYEHLRETYPCSAGKVFYLGVFLDVGPVIIDDPFGGGADVFEVTYQSIQAAVKNLMRHLEVRQSTAVATS
jgi:protein-tyrosine-phosphatase/predicted ATP-grasp superfamily ATP-dependent carboligase